LKKNTAYQLYFSDGGKLERTDGVTLITGSEAEQDFPVSLEE